MGNDTKNTPLRRRSPAIASRPGSQVNTGGIRIVLRSKVKGRAAALLNYKNTYHIGTKKTSVIYAETPLMTSNCSITATLCCLLNSIFAKISSLVCTWDSTDASISEPSRT
jgi:hypothetical protein